MDSPYDCQSNRQSTISASHQRNEATQNSSMPQCFDPRKSGVSEAFTGLEAGAVGEFGSADLLAALQFEGLETQKRCVAARNETVVLSDKKGPGRGACGDKRRAITQLLGKRVGFVYWLGPDVASLTAKGCVSARPESKAAHTVVDFLCRPGPVDAAVFFFQNWSDGGFGMVLMSRNNCTGFEPA